MKFNRFEREREYPKSTLCVWLHATMALWWHRHQCFVLPLHQWNPSEIITSRFKVYWISFSFHYSTAPYHHVGSLCISSCSIHDFECVCLERGRTKNWIVSLSKIWQKPFPTLSWRSCAWLRATTKAFLLIIKSIEASHTEAKYWRYVVPEPVPAAFKRW